MTEKENLILLEIFEGKEAVENYLHKIKRIEEESRELEAELLKDFRVFEETAKRQILEAVKEI